MKSTPTLPNPPSGRKVQSICLRWGGWKLELGTREATRVPSQYKGLSCPDFPDACPLTVQTEDSKKYIFFHLLLKKSRDFPGGLDCWGAKKNRRVSGCGQQPRVRGNEAVLWTFIHLFFPSWTRGLFLVKLQAFSQMLILLTNPKPDIFLRLISISGFLSEL